MQLKELAPLILTSRIIGDQTVDIRDLRMDSRQVSEGDLFVCVSGLKQDGHAYAAQAVERGAAALVVQRELPHAVPQLLVKDSRRALAVLAAHLYGRPSERMQVIGVTGTNGKTTTTTMIERILAACGSRTGLMGTVVMKIGDEIKPSHMTTQDASELQRCFRLMADAGTEHCVMEVSSHALDQGRVIGTRFSTAVFTNLTQDHLDYHGTMERYLAAKALLFSRLGNIWPAAPSERAYAILNADDPASEELMRVTAAEVITYGVDRPADVRGEDVRILPGGNAFTVRTFRGEQKVKTKFIGKFNVYNALAAISAGLAQGLPLERIAGALETMDVVPGRMETVDAGQDYLVVVDYAHTPDGLENALTTIREVARGRVITVFGCGGDRDRAKRPMMGRIAASLSDYCIVTSDNPRTEDPEAILADIEPGVREAADASRYCLEVNRRTAIARAVGMAESGDVILVAGKGHEDYQIIGTTYHHFDDREEVRQAIADRLGNRPRNPE